MTQQQSTSIQDQATRYNRDGSISRTQGTVDEVLSHSDSNR